MVLDTSTLFVAARAMGRVLFIIGVGSVAAQSGLLDKPARSCLANFNLNLFLTNASFPSGPRPCRRRTYSCPCPFPAAIAPGALPWPFNKWLPWLFNLALPLALQAAVP